ncbi:hypothetical protein ACFVVU_16870 [Kitasatospora sp. NPDC057965]|uniref:hypothetical protein n=1 Tax=Kitasatospora sp. NPDC057965 TaxID=3346291 RepID=UPI0036DB3C95
MKSETTASGWFSSPWLVLHVIVGMFLAVLGIGMTFETDPFGAVFYIVCCALPGLWLRVRAPFAPTGVVYHGVARTVRIRWDEVESVQLDVVSGAVFESFCPGASSRRARR